MTHVATNMLPGVNSYLQISYQLWIKVMYGFWLTVIIYSMLVLILIYTYQFEGFPYYWETYLLISKEM